MNDIITAYMKKLFDIFLYDIEVMSQPWMYWWLLVPITCYAVFFIIKWALLTVPVWLPLYLGFRGGLVQIKQVNKED